MMRTVARKVNSYTDRMLVMRIDGLGPHSVTRD